VEESVWNFTQLKFAQL